MRITFFLFFALVVLIKVAPAQSDLPTIGSFADIKGLSKVYVIADNESRKAIVKELMKGGHFAVVEKPEDAEFFLEYKTISRQSHQIGILGVTSETGQLDAYVRRGEKRIIAFSESTTGGGFIGDTARRLTGTFLKREKKELTEGK